MVDPKTNNGDPTAYAISYFFTAMQPQWLKLMPYGEAKIGDTSFVDPAESVLMPSSLSFGKQNNLFILEKIDNDFAYFRFDSQFIKNVIEPELQSENQEGMDTEMANKMLSAMKSIEMNVSGEGTAVYSIEQEIFKEMDYTIISNSKMNVPGQGKMDMVSKKRDIIKIEIE